MILVIVLGALAVFQGEARTLLSVKEKGDTGIYEINYAADYKLDELLASGGAATEEELVQYILKIMLKGLPIEVPYEIPNLACSTFYAEEGMNLLHDVRITGTDPDEKGRIYSTQWSALYDLTNPTLSLCADMNYEDVYIYEVK